LRNKGVLFNLVKPIFAAKAIDAVGRLQHKGRTMMTTTKRTAKTKQPSGASGGVRA
jgi:hypothetical protein